MRKDQWLTGKDLLTKWKIERFELLECVREGLQSYSPVFLKPYEVNSSLFDPPDLRGKIRIVPRGMNYFADPKANVENPEFIFKIDKDLIIPNWEILFNCLEDCLFKKEEIEAFENKCQELQQIKKEKKLRPEQRHKIECRKVATKLWKKYPTMTIAGMIYRQEIIDVSKRSNGDTYMENTVRNWIKDLCPNAKPGRPKKN